MQQATNKLSNAIASEDPVCPWTMLGTESATAVVEAAMEARGGYFGLKAFNRRQENIHMECELSPEGVQKCDEEHKITIDYTIAESDQVLGVRQSGRNPGSDRAQGEVQRRREGRRGGRLLRVRRRRRRFGTR